MFKSIEQAKRVLYRFDRSVYIYIDSDGTEANMLEYAFNRISHFDEKDQLEYINNYVLSELHDYFVDEAKDKYRNKILLGVKEVIKEVLRNKPFNQTLKKNYNDKLAYRKTKNDNITKLDRIKLRMDILKESNFYLDNINDMIIDHYNYFS